MDKASFPTDTMSISNLVLLILLMYCVTFGEILGHDVDGEQGKHFVDSTSNGGNLGEISIFKVLSTP